MCRLICFLTIPITTHRTPANLRVPIPHQKLGFSTLCPLFCLICTIISQKTGHFDQYQNTPGPGSQVPPCRQVRHPLGSKKSSVLWCALVCCSVLQCVAMCCSELHCVAVRCSVLQCGSKKISVRYGAQSRSLTSALLLRESHCHRFEFRRGSWSLVGAAGL